MKVLIAAMFMACAPAQAVTTVYDLAADWSDGSNPAGPWSYEGTQSVPIANHLADWDPSGSTVFAGPQPAWAATVFQQQGHIPVWLKSVGEATGLDLPAGFVAGHAIESDSLRTNVRWTSPLDATIEIAGSVWLLHDIGRDMNWRLLVNNVEVTGGFLLDSEVSLYNSATPFDIANGSGGSGALLHTVSVGDEVSLEIWRRNSSADWVGVNLTLTADSDVFVPEPASILFMSAAAFALCKRRRSVMIAG